MKRTRHTSLMIFALIALLGMGGIYGYMQYAISASVGRAALARDIVRAEEANKSHESDLKKLYEATAADRARLPSFFVKPDRVVDFIEAVEGLGSVAGSEVSISSIDAKEAVTAQVIALGSWTEVMRTLVLAENSPYAVEVSKVRLDHDASGSRQASGKPASGGIWRLTFVIKAALLPQETK